MKKKIMAAVMTAAMVAGLAGATSVYAAEGYYYSWIFTGWRRI